MSRFVIVEIFSTSNSTCSIHNQDMNIEYKFEFSSLFTCCDMVLHIWPSITGSFILWLISSNSFHKMETRKLAIQEAKMEIILITVWIQHLQNLYHLSILSRFELNQKYGGGLNTMQSFLAQDRSLRMYFLGQGHTDLRSRRNHDDSWLQGSLKTFTSHKLVLKMGNKKSNNNVK